MKLGDLVYKITYYTGVHFLVKLLGRLLNFDCGCDKRRQKWNNIKIDRWNS